jgi:hypothetical protein
VDERGIVLVEVADVFIIAIVALMGTVGMLLAFTRWAEERVLQPPSDVLPAETHTSR